MIHTRLQTYSRLCNPKHCEIILTDSSDGTGWYDIPRKYVAEECRPACWRNVGKDKLKRGVESTMVSEHLNARQQEAVPSIQSQPPVAQVRVILTLRVFALCSLNLLHVP